MIPVLLFEQRQLGLESKPDEHWWQPAAHLPGGPSDLSSCA